MCGWAILTTAQNDAEKEKKTRMSEVDWLLSDSLSSALLGLRESPYRFAWHVAGRGRFKALPSTKVIRKAKQNVALVFWGFVSNRRNGVVLVLNLNRPDLDWTDPVVLTGKEKTSKSLRDMYR